MRISDWSSDVCSSDLIIPFVRVMDSLTLAISQGSLRRGSAACYLDVSHPEIEEFLEIRKPSGDFNRKALNLHHGVLITDEFMEAVREDRKSTRLQSLMRTSYAVFCLKTTTTQPRQTYSKDSRYEH